MSRRMPYGAKVFVDSTTPGSIYAGMLSLSFPKRGEYVWRRSGVPTAPSSKLRCELLDAHNPKEVIIARTEKVVFDDGAALGDAYLAAYTKLITYNELVRLDLHDQNLRALWFDAFRQMMDARGALTKIAHP